MTGAAFPSDFRFAGQAHQLWRQLPIKRAVAFDPLRCNLDLLPALVCATAGFESATVYAPIEHHRRLHQSAYFRRRAAASGASTPRRRWPEAQPALQANPTSDTFQNNAHICPAKKSHGM
ncbi:hypothetical protein RFM99_15670 [Mesorhizobium sp. VK4C]|uniref:hypothetical protein n=1 Tax=Mesorhizobium captivum TaxID=3072319 RepID=UPI002A23E450|nr:hypothetical protein [Mesorhizobium sp. VK4C]MDX8499857.1 hypothetical protein [Mesorhizobium sp. VK4C]